MGLFGMGLVATRFSVSVEGNENQLKPYTKTVRTVRREGRGGLPSLPLFDFCEMGPDSAEILT